MLLEDLRREYIFDCQVRELSKQTIANYDKQLGYFLKFMEEKQITTLEDVRPVQIKQYIFFNQERGCKPQYTNDLLKAVKCLFSYAYQEGYTKTLITERIQNVKQPRVLIHTFTEDEIKGFVDYYKGTDYFEIRNKMIIMLLFDTGMRISELLNLKYKQIREGYILVYGKGNKERVVPQSAVISKWLIKYEYAKAVFFFGKDTEDYVFLSRNGLKLTNEAVAHFLKRIAEEIGVNPLVRVSPHTFRHTFAHQQLKNGIDIYSLSRLLGHESISITQTYLNSIRDTQIIITARKSGVLANLR